MNQEVKMCQLFQAFPFALYVEEVGIGANLNFFELPTQRNDSINHNLKLFYLQFLELEFKHKTPQNILVCFLKSYKSKQ